MKASIAAPDVVAVFGSVVKGTQAIIDTRPSDIAVDVKVSFTSINISDSGIPVIWKKREESTMEIVFAVRLVPQRPTPK